MIAAGLCLMGGCFAQDAAGGCVDAYWPVEKISIPYTSASVGIYQYDPIPSGVRLDECRVFTRQKVLSGISSFFYVVQNGLVCYNAYVSIPAATGRHCIDCQYKKNGAVATARENAGWDYPMVVEFLASADGASVWGDGKLLLSCPSTEWNSDAGAGPMRILDSRAGKKEFYVSHGTWGYKWYLQPMKSVTMADAVFDVESQSLVEL